MRTRPRRRIGINPGILPIASVVALLVTIYFINYKMEEWAFVMSGLNIILTQVAFFSLMFTRVMVSSLNPAWSLTIHNTAAAPGTPGHIYCHAHLYPGRGGVRELVILHLPQTDESR